jgi:hypothetical protein
MPISNNSPDTRVFVLVIGARGALGALVADAVRRHGWAVRESSRDPSPSPDCHYYVDLTEGGGLAGPTRVLQFPPVKSRGVVFRG